MRSRRRGPDVIVMIQGRAQRVPEDDPLVLDPNARLWGLCNEPDPGMHWTEKLMWCFSASWVVFVIALAVFG